MKIDFLGIGVQKAGTTWLYHNIREHPELNMATPKEIHYFDKFYSQGHQWYHSHFTNDNKIKGEITPAYIFKKECPKRIYNYNPDIKLILTTRDPTDRAISHYKMHRSRNKSVLPLKEFFDQDKGGIKSRGLYKHQIERYLQYFNKEQLLILDFNMIIHQPKKYLNKVFDFLGVEKVYNSNLNKKIRPVKRDNIEIKEKDIQHIKNYYKCSTDQYQIEK